VLYCAVVVYIRDNGRRREIEYLMQDFHLIYAIERQQLLPGCLNEPIKSQDRRRLVRMIANYPQLY